MKYLLFILCVVFSLGGVVNTILGIIEKDYGRQALGLIELIMWASIGIWNYLEITEGNN